MTAFAVRMTRALALRPRLDSSFTLALALLITLGLAVLYSATDGTMSMLYRQLIRFAVGIAVFLVFAQMPPSVLRRWTPPIYAVCIVLLIAVALLGEGRGAQRWLDLGFVRFQPSELLKITVPMMLAWYLHRVSLPPGLKDLTICAVIIAVPAAMIARQPDLGTALLVAASGGFVLFLAGLRWRVIIGLAVAGLSCLPVLWQFMHEYQRNRVLTMLNPEADPLGKGWNIIQSKIAVGSGGLFGKGYQQGTQSHLDFLPESSTDFILAVFAEEFGLVGVLVLFTLYAYIIIRGLTLAGAGRGAYERLLAGSLMLTFFVYVAVNAGMISGILPIVGIPLPLVSYGGTSIVSLMAGFGIIMSVFSHRRLLKRP